MQRLLIRLSVLSVVVVLGLITIAQARHGFNRDASGEPQVSNPSPGAPQPISVDPPSSGVAASPVVNPLRRSMAQNSGGSGYAQPGTNAFARRASGTNEDIPPAEVVLADEPQGPPPVGRADRARYEAAPGTQPTNDRYAQLQNYTEPDIDQSHTPGADTLPDAPISGASQYGTESQQDRFAEPENNDYRRPELTETPPRDSSRPIPAAAEPDDFAPGPLEPTPADRGTPSTSEQGPETDLRSRDNSYETPSMLRSGGADMGASSSSGDHGTGRPGAKQLEGPQAPSITIQKTAPAEIQVGKECKFEIMIRNVGATVAEGVEVHDEIPQGTTLVSTSPRAGRGPSGQLIFRLDRLEPGQDAKLEVVLMPIEQGEIGSVATVHLSAQASVRTRATKPELDLLVTAPPTVMIGETVQLSIKISNPGTGAATGVMLLENIPQGLNHPAGPSLEFEVGTLMPGETREMMLPLTAEQAGRITNMLVARADANLEVRKSADFEIIAPELTVGVTGPKKRYLERQATYTLSVDNPGTAPAKDIELTTYLPKGMKFVEANNSGQYDPVSHSVSWGLEELPAKEGGSVEFVAIPIEAGTQQLRVEGKAERGLKDEAEQIVEVEGLAAILFTVADAADPVEVDGETTYEVHVVNQGSKESTNVGVTVLLPPGMQVVDASGPARHSAENGRVVFAPLARLAAKADTTYHVTVRAGQKGDQRVRVQVITDDMQTPVTKEESTQVYADE